MKNEIETNDNLDASKAVTSIKSFKATSEVENFYRFIHDNKIRFEAKKLIEVVLKEIKPVKKRGRKKTIQ